MAIMTDINPLPQTNISLRWPIRSDSQPLVGEHCPPQQQQRHIQRRLGACQIIGDHQIGRSPNPPSASIGPAIVAATIAIFQTSALAVSRRLANRSDHLADADGDAGIRCGIWRDGNSPVRCARTERQVPPARTRKCQAPEGLRQP